MFEGGVKEVIFDRLEQPSLHVPGDNSPYGGIPPITIPPMGGGVLVGFDQPTNQLAAGYSAFPGHLEGIVPPAVPKLFHKGPCGCRLLFQPIEHKQPDQSAV